MRRISCSSCEGNGVVDDPVSPCPFCEGLGFLYFFPGGSRGRSYSAAGIAGDVDFFQQWAASVWFAGFGDDLNAPLTMERDLPIMTLGLAGETGEALEVVKKHIRDGELDREKLIKELGDVFYYLCRVASFYEISASSFALENIKKCEGRIKRGTRRGSGSDR